MKRATIRLGPVLVGSDLSQPEKLERNRWYYHPAALRLPDGGVPLVIDHNPERPIGRVHQVYETTDDEGRAVYCRATVTADPPHWLKERFTQASLCFLEEDAIALGNGAVLYTAGIVREVTLRSPRANPARDRSARVIKLETIKQTAMPMSRRRPEVDLRPKLLVRNFGAVLDVR